MSKRVKSQDPVVEGLKRLMQVGEGTTELPAGATADELESLLLTELRRRRERLARFMQMIREEVQRESAGPRASFRNRPPCRKRSSRLR